MKLLILLLLSPAVICTQRLRKSADPNNEPFLPIHPQYPYNPKLMKRGLEQQQQQQQQQPIQQTSSQQQAYAQLTPELYAPKVDARDSYTTSFAQSPTNYAQSPYYANYDPYSKATSSANALTSSPYYQSSYSANPYSNLLQSYASPYSAAASPAAAYGAAAAPSSAAYGAAAALSPSAYGASPYGPASSGYGVSPYAATGAIPNYYNYQPPYYYPNYYGPYAPPPPPPGYPGGPPSKYGKDDEDDDEDDKRREKNKKYSGHKNKLRSSDSDNQYVDGANYIISSAKDLDGESSTHRTPSHYNQIEQDGDTPPRGVIVPKATYRLIRISGQPDSNPAPAGYIKIQQLEQLMRQTLARLLAQNAAQQASLAQIQQEAQQISKDGQQYVALPNTIAKTGLSYVVNPTILNRINAGQYNPSQLLRTNTDSKPYAQKTGTSVTLQQSPGIYIPPSKQGNNDQPLNDYGDYDAPESATSRSQGATAEPTRFPYSTYRPTQQPTTLEDVNFGTKQKTKS